MLEINRIHNSDCFEGIKLIDDKSINCIITDPPFNLTNYEWDKIINFDKLWIEYKRIIKDNGVIIIFGSQPFTSLLICSNLEWFKYEIIWIKHQATNPMFAKKGILKCHENICVFYKNQPSYNPQLEYDKPYSKFESRIGKKIGAAYNSINSEHRNNPNGERYPVSFLYYPNPNKNKYHPNQKPLDLIKYLIMTYTNENDLILDSFIGGGQTAIASRKLNRNFIGFENNEIYYKISCERIGQKC